MALCTTTPHLVHFKRLKFILYDLTVGSFKKGKSNGYWASFKKKCMCPFLNYFKNYVNYFLVLLSYLLHPWKKILSK